MTLYDNKKKMFIEDLILFTESEVLTQWDNWIKKFLAKIYVSSFFEILFVS